MNEPAPTAKPEPTPFEKLQQFTQQVLSVPKAEIDRREEQWRKAKKAKRQPNRS